MIEPTFFFFVKILILTALYPPLGATGHDYRCRQVVLALSKRQNKIQVLTSNYRVPPMGVIGEFGVFRELVLQDENALTSDSSIAAYTAASAQELVNASALDSRLQRFQPDVVYVWNMNGVSKSLLLSLQAQGIPIVYDLSSDWLKPEVFNQDPWFRWWQSNDDFRAKCHQMYFKMTGSARRQLRNYPVGEPSDLDLSNAYVSSESLRDQLVAAGVPQVATVPVFYPALDTSELHVKTSYQRPVRKFMWAGRLTAAKSPALALRAVGVLKSRGIDVSLDFYGMGQPKERKAMRDIINRSGLDGAVRKIGIRPGELNSRYQQYDGLLFTSDCNDPFPMTPLEGMLSGLPAILSRDGGIVEIVEDGETALLYKAGDVDALADAMVRLMDLPDGGEAMAQKCIERLQERHSLDMVIDQIEARLAASIESSTNALLVQV